MGKRLVARAWLVASVLLMATAVHAGDVPVDRGAYTLQAQVQGDGPVVVVFESGFGQGPGVWKDVITDLGAQCRCIAYARAGLGRSGTDGKAKTIKEHVADLSAVIDTLVPKGRVVLVGHSYGGLLATEYARRHPQRLQGLVLVDPATWGQRHDTLKADRARVLADDKALLAMLPPKMAADYRILVAQLESPDATRARIMPDVPVALLTSTRVADKPFVFEETSRGKALWKAEHAALFATFSRGTHRYVATGHNIEREQPQAVVEAIRSVAVTDRGMD
ncbi:alpha/beta fold hydrolase [Oleiagrimonas sp. C23AA]|uniref:alpha/beta fold hydrolase n=1 Tax=Oleiagrimonas sp. C23AA TaxID=2719047 RepID=UPI0014214C15|nr:alpha/beta fold hydrolase [Oleiagrimonas sp. C23AA]NII09485.1 alpha/beta fold hydrolase [Oleiagrimonas sp. C23AA]